MAVQTICESSWSSNHLHHSASHVLTVNLSDVIRQIKENNITDAYSQIIPFNLSDVISQIEENDIMDAYQLLFEVFITVLAVGGNGLTIIVLWNVARKQPAQALRLALAIADLLAGMSGCAMALFDHCFFLWCATAPKPRCSYEVEVTIYDGGIHLLRGGLPLVASIVYFVSFGCSFGYLVFMAIDRMIAICNPLKYKLIVTVSRVRKAIVSYFILTAAYSALVGIIEDPNGRWKSVYRPVTKTSVVLLTNRTMKFINSIVLITHFILVVISFASVTCITVWYMKRARIVRRTLHGPQKCNAIPTVSSHISSFISSLKKISQNNIDDNSKYKIKEETDIDISMTLILSMLFFLLAVIPNVMCRMIKRSSRNDMLNFLLKWLFLSSSSTNFIIYNLRISSLRQRSWEVVSTPVKAFINLRFSHGANLSSPSTRASEFDAALTKVTSKEAI